MAKATTPDVEKKATTPDVEMVDKTEIKTTTEMKETEGGIIVPETKTLVKQPYYVKNGGKDTFIVVSQNGQEMRIYKKEKGCEDPKGAAESYAKKLSSQFI